MPTFIKMGLFGMEGMDYKAQYEHDNRKRAEWDAKERNGQAIKSEAIRQTEIATGKKYVNINGIEKYITLKQYKKLIGDINA